MKAAVKAVVKAAVKAAVKATEVAAAVEKGSLIGEAEVTEGEWKILVERMLSFLFCFFAGFSSYRGPNNKKDGGGAHNWGSVRDEVK